MPVATPSAEARAGASLDLSTTTRTALEIAGVASADTLKGISEQRAKEGDRSSITAMRRMGEPPCSGNYK
ncbi:hypothetical protein HY025_05900 [Candidatus Daviesbacteria bacterium]|nr:hypothetical protein [Candidatus Daviesbacteria bacterium]